jgi:putative protease
MEKKEIGEITHFFGKIMVAAIKLTDTLKVGEKISIEGTHTGFEQAVESMQIEKQNIEEAKPGDEIGIKVSERVREGDKVYKVME